MAHYFATYAPDATFGGSGVLVRAKEVSGTQDVFPLSNQMSMPTDFVATGTRPVATKYKGRMYLVGWGIDNVMVDEHGRAGYIGIQPPTSVPTLAAAAGGAITGSAVGYVAFYDERTDIWSPLSGASASVALAAQGRAWTNIPTSTDSRVTHVGLFVSMDGALPRLAVKRTIGTTAASEGMPTASLGDTLSTFGLMPRATVAAIYHDRLVVAGARDPSKLYFSEVGRPERRAIGLEFTTRAGEPIVALVPTREQLLVLCPSSSYVLRGYTSSDLTLDSLDPAIGAFSQYATAMIHDYVVVANHDGVFLWNGGWHRINNDIENYWLSRYAQYQVEFEVGFWLKDETEQTCAYYVSNMSLVAANWELPDPASLAGTVAVGFTYSDIIPQQGGGFAQPKWYLDVMTRHVSSGGELGTSGAQGSRPFLGHCDGYVRRKLRAGETAATYDDDGDTYGKAGWIRLAPFYGIDPGGGIHEGKTWKRVVVFARSENSDFTAYFKAGDEEAYRHLLPTNEVATTPAGWFKRDVAATALLNQAAPISADWTGFVDYAPESVHDMPIDVSLAGRGLTIEVKFIAANGIDFRGVMLQWQVTGNPARGVVAHSAE